MSRPPLHAPAPSAWAWAFLAAVLAGTYLRLDQFLDQVLIDDEWHAVHQVLSRTPAAMLRDFGYADYSIPLGILDWYQSQWFGLSEAAMRWPMLLCGLVTLVALPLYVMRRLPGVTASVFALLLAFSPLLVMYSRMARPYALTLLLAWTAHAAYQRYHAVSQGGLAAGLVYGVSTTLAVWLHPIIAPFAVAPLLWGLAQLRTAAPGERGPRFLRLLGLALATGAAVAVFVLPPLVLNPASITGKAGVDAPDFQTLLGATYLWVGTPFSTVVVVFVALAVLGARTVWRALPEARSGTLGLAMTFLAVMLTRPMWSFDSLPLARYLLPIVPLLLLMVAAGAVWVAGRLVDTATARAHALFAIIASSPAIVLAATSPLAPMLRHPNGQTLHMVHIFEFRPGKNRYREYMDAIPLSPFWATLASVPAGSLRIAVAPFYFESYDWDAPRWEALARQTVLPGYLTGLCVDKRWGELPRAPAFAFRNAVHLADAAALAEHRIDYVVWQKPYARMQNGNAKTVGADTAHCEAVIRERFGLPAYEDAYLVAFRLNPSGAVAPHA